MLHLRLKTWNTPFLWLPQQVPSSRELQQQEKICYGGEERFTWVDPSSHPVARQQLRTCQTIFRSLQPSIHTLWGSRHLWSGYSPPHRWSRAFPDTSKHTEGLLLILYPQTARGWRILLNCARSKQFGHCTQQEEEVKAAPRLIFACDINSKQCWQLVTAACGENFSRAITPNTAEKSETLHTAWKYWTRLSFCQQTKRNY